MPIFENPGGEEPGTRPDASQASREPDQPRPQGRTSREARQKLRQQLKQADRKIAKQEMRISALQAMLAKRDAGQGEDGIRPENIIWVFGSGRTGSSWLTFMIGALPDHTRWNEPLVGQLFGSVYRDRTEVRQAKPHFILSRDFDGAWLGCIRDLVLEGANARFPERTQGGYLVIKEPHGSLGAPLLMEALPKSRMIFLVRDPRDVVASAMAVTFVPKNEKVDRSWRVEIVEERPEVFVEKRARNYARDIAHTRQAFEAHEGPKALVRYEDLRADTLATMTRIYSDLEVPVGGEELARVVRRFSWENVPEEEKGEGTIRRKAKPGGWREDLTEEQIGIVEREAASVLEQFYPEA